MPALSAWWNGTVQPKLEQSMRSHFKVNDDAEFVMRDLFVVRYTTDTQPGLPLHADGSHLSFNVMLSNHSDFDGGGTFYDALDTVLKPTQGEVLVHHSHILHAGVNVTKGARYIVVGFVWVQSSSAQWWRLFGSTSHCFDMLRQTPSGTDSEVVCVSFARVLWKLLNHTMEGIWEVADQEDSAWIGWVLRGVLGGLVCMVMLLVGIFGYEMYEARTARREKQD
eukprot:TRINITY_DN3466_c0_g1_i3.p1 TRINITY_DN3466_c0_g1~~TRINITY_DN3466_c0_g1_i3.p1  ORF type:complete len:223 (-),score=45.65 TRINITY_DN3466_c0_g1_i3:301-969(-)